MIKARIELCPKYYGSSERGVNSNVDRIRVHEGLTRKVHKNGASGCEEDFFNRSTNVRRGHTRPRDHL